MIRTTERCSLSESRHSIGSAKHQPQSQHQQYRRSSDYHRAHNPRVLTPTLPAPRQSNYRSPSSVYRASKRMVQHQNSQASLLYGYPQHHH